MRTQQILALENRVADVVDPLGGSYYVEILTTRLEEEAESLIRAGAGSRRHGAVDRGRLHPAPDRRCLGGLPASVESESEYIVGVNIHVEPEAPLPFEPFVLDPGLVERQIKRTQGIRTARPQAEHAAALKEIERRPRGDRT